MNLKQSILERTNGGELLYKIILNQYGIPFEKKDSTSYESTFNPYYDDTNPSLSIFKNDSNEMWYHNDFGTNDEGAEYKGDIFSFAMNYFNLCQDQFTELLYRIDHLVTTSYEFGNTIEINPIKEKYKNVIRYTRKEITNYNGKILKVDLFKMSPSRECEAYFNQYGINLNKHNYVHQVSGYRLLDEDGIPLSSLMFQKPEKIIHIAYDFGNYCKIYRVDPKKFWYIGNKTGEYVFGSSLDQAKYINEIIFIVGGEKDAMVLNSLDYPAFCLGSETVMPSQRLIKNLYEARYKPVILYDSDSTGISGAIKIKDKFNYPIADLASIIPKDCPYRIKDISDYIKYDVGKERLIEYLDSFKWKEGQKEETVPIPEHIRKRIVKKRKVDKLALIVNKNKVNKKSERINDSKALIENIGIKVSKGIKDSKDFKELEPTEGNTLEDTPIIYKGISQDAFDKLPKLLNDICSPIEESHERDLVLLSSLSVLSNIFNVYGIYDNRIIYPNLFVFITAKPSAGKGVLRWVKMLGSEIHKQKLETYKDQLAFYNNLEFEDKKEEERPVKQTYYIPGNASSASMVKQLSNNNGYGVIIESEADSLNAVLDKEWGNYSDILRKAFEFETISVLRQNDENSFEIDEPRLSVILTGTQQQLLNLVPNSENGLFSRFMFLEFPLIKKWKNAFERKIDFKEHYQNIAIKLKKHYNSDRKSFEVVLTKSQQKTINDKFTKYQNQYDGLLGEDIIASIRRTANIHFRICMLLTAIRQMDEKEKKEVMCSDDDFEIANQLAIVQLENVIKIYGYLPKVNMAMKKLHLKQTELYESLSDDFSSFEVMENAEKLNIPKGTAENYLRIFQKHQLAERVSQGKYRKIKL